MPTSSESSFFAAWAALCATAWAGGLTLLDLSQNYLSDEAYRSIAASGRFARLRTLHLNFNHADWLEGAERHEVITDAGARARMAEG